MATAFATEETAHDVVEELLPESFDWEGLVRKYPIPALLLAAAGGFALGRHRGGPVLGALSSYAALRVAEGVNELLGEEVVDGL